MTPAWFSNWMRRTSVGFIALVLALVCAAAAPMPRSLVEDNDGIELLSKANMIESVRAVRRVILTHGHHPEAISRNHLNTDAAVRLPISIPAPFASERCSCMRC